MAPQKKIARPGRKTVAAKGKAAPPSALGPLPAAAGRNERYSWARLLIAVLATLGVYEIARLIHHDPAPKDFQVQILSRISGDEKSCGPFSGWGIAPIGRDKICIADTGHNRLLVFDRKGGFLRSWGKLGQGPKEFHEPSGMASDDKGNAYVMDAWNGAIKGFDENGKPVLNLPLGNNGFFGPRGLAYDGKNFVIADTGNNRIVVLSPKGDIQAHWGGLGSGPGKFRGPLAVASDGKGDYFVADSGNNRTQWLDKAGKVVRTIPGGSTVPAIAVDQEGRVYVAGGSSARQDRVEVYGPRGDDLGDLKDQDGFRDYFEGIRWMSISRDDVLMVSDGETAFAFQIPKEKP